MCLRKAKTIASSAIESTVDFASFGPVFRSATEPRFFHLATVLGLMPYRLERLLATSRKEAAHEPQAMALEQLSGPAADGGMEAADQEKVLAGRLMTSDHGHGIRIRATTLGPVERRRACQEVALGTRKVYMGRGVRRLGYGERHSVEKTERENSEG